VIKNIIRNRQEMTGNHSKSPKNSPGVTIGVTKFLTNIIKTLRLI